MLNLEKFSGLPISLRDDLSLEFEKGLPPVTPSFRDFSTSRNFYKEPSSTYWRKSVYDMYRSVAFPEHAALFREFGIEYDLTIIPPGRISKEFARTIGHYHSMKPGTTLGWPEIYEVVYGKCFYILQNRVSPDSEKLSEIYIVELERGENLVIPPGFGHVGVNPTDDLLVLSNWQPTANVSDYEPYEKHNGPAYYAVASEHLSASGKTSSEHCEFVPNLSYDLLPKVIHARPRELTQYDLRTALPLYFTGSKNINNLDFLVNPENYLSELTPDKLYKY